MKKNISILLIVFVAQFIHAQQKFVIRDVDVTSQNRKLVNAWCGGINSPVMSDINLNDDAYPDLFIIDKYGSKVMTFINQGPNVYPTYKYTPEYEKFFPKELWGWAVIRDFNKDGVPDIFSLTNGAMQCWRGKKVNGILSFDFYQDEVRFRISPTITDHIWTFINDLPGLTDVNGDGDMDVLSFDILGGATVNYYENQAVEMGYSLDSLVYLNITNCWGNFVENSTTNSLFLHASCKGNGLQGPISSGSSARHQGGTMFTFDYEGDRDVDLLLGDVSSPGLIYAENSGDTAYADVNYIDSMFPKYSTPINLPIFPAAYNIDYNNDGYKDLMIAPFNYDQGVGFAKDINNVQVYRNSKVSGKQEYSYAGDTFFVNQIVDAGSDSRPMFEDVDRDGKWDIVMGENGQYSGNPSPRAKLYYLHNVSVGSNVQFELDSSSDWCGVSAFSMLGLYPAFGDLDGDSLSDMVTGNNSGYLFFYKNNGTAKPYTSITTPQLGGIDAGEFAKPFIYDVNEDGLNDIVVGNKEGRVNYYWNFGTKTSPKFDVDSVNPFLGTIRVNDWQNNVLWGYAAPFIAKEATNTFLYSGSERGLVFKYQINRDSLRRGSFLLVDSDVLGYNAGSRSTISIADINSDGKPEYLVGNQRGGMMMLSELNWNNDTTTAIEEPTMRNNNLVIYPNPARNVLKIESSNDLRNTQYQIFDLTGNIVLDAAFEGKNEINVSALPNGVYVLHLVNDKYTIARKFTLIK
jgi:hypothetical protein